MALGFFLQINKQKEDMELRRKYASISAKVVWTLSSSVYLGYYALSLYIQEFMLSIASS